MPRDSSALSRFLLRPRAQPTCIKAMTSRAITPRGATRRRSHRATTVAAIRILGLCAGVVFLALWFLRWSILWPVIATIDSMALVVAAVWVDKITKRDDSSMARRAARRMRDETVALAAGFGAQAAHETPENVLAQAIERVDSIAFTAGGIWLDKLGKRSIAVLSTRPRAAKPVLAR